MLEAFTQACPRAAWGGGQRVVHLNSLSALDRFGLARLHPLLAHTLALKEANSITAAVTPLALHFPAEVLTVRVLPLKLQIKGNRLMRGAIRMLEGRWGQGSGP